MDRFWILFISLAILLPSSAAGYLYYFRPFDDQHRVIDEAIVDWQPGDASDAHKFQIMSPESMAVPPKDGYEQCHSPAPAEKGDIPYAKFRSHQLDQSIKYGKHKSRCQHPQCSFKESVAEI